MHRVPLLVSLSLLIPACGAVEAENADDIAVAEEASTGTEGSAELMLVADFTAEIAASGGDLELPACVTVDTDGLTYFDVTFTDCTLHGHLFVNGSVRAERGVEAGGVMVYDLTATDITIGTASFTGAWELRVPLSSGAARAFAGTSTTVGPRGRTVTTEASAEWTTDGACVTYSYDASIARAVGTSTVVADSVTRCEAACPSAGSVTVSYAVGGSLSWTYDGDETVTVTSARGEFELALMCAYQ